VTLVLIPVQAVLKVLPGRGKRCLPFLYHRLLTRILGIGLTFTGSRPAEGPVLIVSNHQSWLDIPSLSTLAPLSFISKSEVSSWPFFGTLARLQRTVFIERADRRGVDRQNSKITDRLSTQDRLVLFAEGTSSDGNRVLPFKTALFASAQALKGEEPWVQAASIAYTRVHGIPMGRQFRPYAAWYGDMNLLSHLWAVVRLGPLDCAIHLHTPVQLSDFSGRKALAAHIHDEIVTTHRRLLQGLDPDVTEGGEPLDSAPMTATLPAVEVRT